MYARAKMPFGQREKSLRSIAAHSTSLTLVSSAICSRETPRWIRMRRRLGPKASRPLMAGVALAKLLPWARPRGWPRFWSEGPPSCRFFLRRITKPSWTSLHSSVELPSGWRLRRPPPAGDDVGAGVVLGLDFRAGQAAQHRELADVRQRVGDRALEDALGWDGERRLRRQVVVEALHGREKAFDLAVPFERRRIVPRLGALRLRQRPVEQIADVREDL